MKTNIALGNYLNVYVVDEHGFLVRDVYVIFIESDADEHFKDNTSGIIEDVVEKTIKLDTITTKREIIKKLDEFDIEYAKVIVEGVL